MYLLTLTIYDLHKIQTVSTYVYPKSNDHYFFLFLTGTFLVAYISIGLILGIPLTFLEITLGQFCQQGTTKLWRAVPLFKGKLWTALFFLLFLHIFIINLSKCCFRKIKNILLD